MGYVEKRGKNSWRICVDVKVGGSWVPIRTTLRMDPDLPEAVQRRDAERELRNLEKRLAADQETAFTLRDWAEEWLRKVVAPDASPVTVHNYRHLLDSRILPALGGYALRDLTPAILTDWLLTVRAAPRKSTRLPEEKLARPRGKGERLAPPSRRGLVLCREDFLQGEVAAGERGELFSAAVRAAQAAGVRGELLAAVQAAGRALELLDHELHVLELGAVGDGLPAVGHVGGDDAAEGADLNRDAADLLQRFLLGNAAHHFQERVTDSKLVHAFTWRRLSSRSRRSSSRGWPRP